MFIQTWPVIDLYLVRHFSIMAVSKCTIISVDVWLSYTQHVFFFIVHSDKVCTVCCRWLIFKSKLIFFIGSQMFNCEQYPVFISNLWVNWDLPGVVHEYTREDYVFACVQRACKATWHPCQWKETNRGKYTLDHSQYD